jgi:hypothetical protein
VRLSRSAAVTVSTFALLAAGAGTASAGEVTGTGGDTQGPAHANSICVFSGLNDDPAEEPGKTQSYGQAVRAGLKAFVPSPGVACNGHTGFLAIPPEGEAP